MLIGRLGHDNLGRHLCHSLTEGDDRVRDPDLCSTHEILLQVLQANLQVKLSSTRNDVLSCLLNGTLHHWIRLGQPLQPCSRHYLSNFSLWQSLPVLQRLVSNYGGHMNPVTELKLRAWFGIFSLHPTTSKPFLVKFARAKLSLVASSYMSSSSVNEPAYSFGGDAELAKEPYLQRAWAGPMPPWALQPHARRGTR